MLSLNKLNKKHRKTVEAIFSNPVSGNIELRKVEAMFVALGCEIIEGSGSRITILYGEQKVAFHRPHPKKEALRYRMSATRDFLEMIGIKP